MGRHPELLVHDMPREDALESLSKPCAHVLRTNVGRELKGTPMIHDKRRVWALLNQQQRLLHRVYRCRWTNDVEATILALNTLLPELLEARLFHPAAVELLQTDETRAVRGKCPLE